MSYTTDTLWEEAQKTGNWKKAFEGLSQSFNRHLHEAGLLSQSRFIAVDVYPDTDRVNPESEECDVVMRVNVRKVTEESISHAIDMSDCHDNTEKYFYVDDNGKFQPVTTGKMERSNIGDETPFRYGSSTLIAGGKCVGEVVHTDH